MMHESRLDFRVINCHKVDLVKKILSRILKMGHETFGKAKVEGCSLFEALSRVTISSSLFKPYFLREIFLGDMIKKLVILLEEVKPLRLNVILKDIAMRFYHDPAISIVEKWGAYDKIIHNLTATRLMPHWQPCSYFLLYSTNIVSPTSSNTGWVVGLSRDPTSSSIAGHAMLPTILLAPITNLASDVSSCCQPCYWPTLTHLLSAFGH